MEHLTYLPLILTIVGWGVVNGASAKREIRKEKRAEADSCIKMAADILVKARFYYTHDSGDFDAIKTGREIVFDLHRLMKRVERLEKDYPKFDVSSLLNILHEYVTGDNFESATRVKISHDDLKISGIEHYTHAVIDQIEDGFSNTFR